MKSFDAFLRQPKHRLLAAAVLSLALPCTSTAAAPATADDQSHTAPPAVSAASRTDAATPDRGRKLPALSIGIHRFHVEVANTPESRQKGLMNRDALAPDTGMLFVFPQPAVQCMWMKNTRIPLSVAFVDEDSRILNIESMQPHTEISHCSRGPALFALEMAQGWFDKRRIVPGARISGADPR